MSLLFSLLLGFGLGVAKPQEQEIRCDVLLHAHRIHGVASDDGGAFVAWRGGSIVAAGPSAEAARLDAKRTLHRPRAFVAPGLVDAHGHLLGLGDALFQLNLVGTTSYAEVIERVAERAKNTPRGEWILGRGWDQNDWPVAEFPEHDALSKAVPDHPVWLRRIDGHAALANALAMKLAGVPDHSEDVPGGRVLRNAAGLPSGVFVDRAMAQVGSKVRASPRPVKDRLIAAQARLLTVGLTGVHDAGINSETVDALEELIAAGQWHVRIYGMWSGRLERQEVLDHASGMLEVRAVKIYADGALGSRGAALLAPYADEAGVMGLETTSKTALEALYAQCLKHGFQACTHAIGDRGNRNVLEAFSAASQAAGLDREARQARRFRLEHAQVLAPEDFASMKDLGLLASMQPTHATSDMDWAELRLGHERAQGAYAWRTMLKHQIPLSFGSDFPVEDCDPRLGIYAALTRMHPDGTPEGGWFRDQCLSEAETIDAFSAGAAYAAFQEAHRGRIAAGFDADLSVFDPDPALGAGAASWLQTKAVVTVVNGYVALENRD